MNLKDVMKQFSDEQACRDFLVQQRWNGCPECPYCGSDKWYRIEDGKRFKCGNSKCYKKYSVTVGTVFHASNIPLTTWFAAMYIMTAHKKGISSVQLAKDLGVTQKTGWFILHRIRESLKDNNSTLLGGMVEVDETYIGGKIANKHKKVRKEWAKTKDKRSNKSTVLGIVQRGGRLTANHIKSPSVEEIKPIIDNTVEYASNIVTDGSRVYEHINAHFYHNVVDHSKDEFVRGIYHTNTIEGFFAYLKRSIFGIYHQVSPKHLQSYCNENAYRYNLRDMNDGERFTFALSHIQGRLTYKQLVHGNKEKDSNQNG